MNINVKVTGVDEIDSVLKVLPLALTDSILQQAGSNAGKILVNKAKLLAPEGPTGYLIDSIGVVKGRFNQVVSLQRDIGAVTIGPRRGRYKGYAAHLVEYGTRKRQTKGRGKKRIIRKANRGTMPRKPFMKPAFDATIGQMQQSYNAFVSRRIIQVMRKKLK